MYYFRICLYICLFSICEMLHKIRPFMKWYIYFIWHKSYRVWNWNGVAFIPKCKQIDLNQFSVCSRCAAVRFHASTFAFRKAHFMRVSHVGFPFAFDHQSMCMCKCMHCARQTVGLWTVIFTPPLHCTSFCFHSIASFRWVSLRLFVAPRRTFTPLQNLKPKKNE